VILVIKRDCSMECTRKTKVRLKLDRSISISTPNFDWICSREESSTRMEKACSVKLIWALSPEKLRQESPNDTVHRYTNYDIRSVEAQECEIRSNYRAGSELLIKYIQSIKEVREYAIKKAENRTLILTPRRVKTVT
jgi:hypothetical protein